MTSGLLPLVLAALVGSASAETGPATVIGRVIRDNTLEVTVRVDRPVTEAWAEALYREFESDLSVGQRLRVFGQDASGRRVTIESLLPMVPPPGEKPFEWKAWPGEVRTEGEGFLAGRTVFLSPGHGWFHDPPSNRWETQRPVTNALVEDFSNIDAVTHFLVGYLENMGAEVWVVRERDRNTNIVIVDNGESDPQNGTYAEVGPPEKFLDSSLLGYGHVPLPYDGNDNPMAQGTMRLMATIEGISDASVVWTPNIPADGDYAVYVSYGSYSNRPEDAHYRVLHKGGSTDLYIHQRQDGFTWRYLGTFPFQAGHLPGAQEVVLYNDTADPTASYASIDAVRFGGGPGDIDRGDGVSGRPRYEECSRYYTQYTGAPSSAYQYYSTDRDADVVARPRYAAWENEATEDSIYFSWHTNAPNPGSGTSSYIYSVNPTWGSAELQDYVHSEVIDDLHAGYDATWVDRGQLSAAFGEVNPNHNPEMPAMLMEVAFHDTPSDALRLKDTPFLETVARAIAQGIGGYFAWRDGLTLALPPEPPARLRVTLLSPTSARAAWDAPDPGPPGLYGDPPTSYRVYVSEDGRAFGPPAFEVSGTTADLTGLPAGVPKYVRVVSVNSGGVSFPSPTLAVHRPSATTAARRNRILYVNGYTRMDPYILPETTELVDGDTPVTSGGTGYEAVDRYRREEINTSDYVVEHARALAGLPVALESATREAVSAGLVSLTPYKLVIWAAGRQAEVYADDPVDNTSLSASERAVLETYLAAGGRIFITGAEVAYDLDRDSDPNDPESLFMHNWLKTMYVSDTAQTYNVIAVPGGPLQNVPPFSFDDGSGPSYNVEWPDRVGVTGGSVDALTYQGGLGGTASTSYTGTHRALFFGFPFESVVGDQARRDLMIESLKALLR